MLRYAYVTEKYPREVVLLRSQGCSWGKCGFCDYHLDRHPSVAENAALNRSVLKKVRGGVLQVIDSAAFNELPIDTLLDILQLDLDEVILEQHWRFRDNNASLAKLFKRCKFILGLESFDHTFRMNVLNKNVEAHSPEEYARAFQWVNLLVGIHGQSFSMIERDIALGLAHFERVTVNVFVPNSTRFRRDAALVERFYASDLFAEIKNSDRVEILDYLDERAPDRLGNVGYDESA